MQYHVIIRYKLELHKTKRPGEPISTLPALLFVRLDSRLRGINLNNLYCLRADKFSIKELKGQIPDLV